MKEFTCVCGSKEFCVDEVCETLADFSKEGAIEGHPFLGGRNIHFTGIHCAKCKTQVLGSVVAEMRKEII